MSEKKIGMQTSDIVNEICRDFIAAEEDSNGLLKRISFQNEDDFNFAYDVVDVIAKTDPHRLAMLHIDKNQTERRFTFEDMRVASNQCANYFKQIGIKKGNRVMLILKRHYQFWYCILALHKIGAVVVPATNLLQVDDLAYRFESAKIDMIVSTVDDDVPQKVEIAQRKCGLPLFKVLVGGDRKGWHDFDAEYGHYADDYPRSFDSPCGNDVMLMFFTSGTTGQPKIAVHNYKYALGHYITAKYWQGVSEKGLHFTISETGWGKALWGKLYGQWLCKSAVFTYDFDRFDAEQILPLFSRYQITTFCAPPTMLRMMIKQDISKYDLSSLQRITTAGEALNPEVSVQFERHTGLKIMEGFGQTELTLIIANLLGDNYKFGSMGKATPLYEVSIIDDNCIPLSDGSVGEIAVRIPNRPICGLFMGYFNDVTKNEDAFRGGYYHTGDTGWRDEDGYFWYVGRKDDIIKSSGYRIGPYEIENVLMELPYVVECGVSGVPDELRGKVVKASIVLTSDKLPSDELKKEIQDYVKSKTAPYKYPRVVEFVEELPKTISGKIIRSKL